MEEFAQCRSRLDTCARLRCVLCRAPRPQLIQLSSAGVERNAIIGDDVERRKKDIPIIQLNPAGTLNHK